MLHWRAAELAVLLNVLRRAHSGQGHLVVIEAARGMGRSMLAAAAAAEAVELGLRTLFARGSVVEQGFAHGVALQLMEPVVQRTSIDERERLFAGPAAWARPLLEPTTSPGTTGSDDGHFRAAHGLYWMVDHLTQTAPVALVVDDLQAADEPSLLFLSHLTERLDDVRCSMILTTTVTREEHPLVRRLRCHPRATVIQLEPLATDVLATHLHAEQLRQGSRTLCSAVAGLSGGSPLLATQLADAIDPSAGVPECAVVERLEHLATRSVHNAVVDQISGLDAIARAVAIAAALLADDATLDAAAHVAGVDRGAAVDAARTLVMAGLVRGADPLELTSPVVAGVLRDLIPAGELAERCRRAADALTALGRSHLQVAPHLVATEPAGDDSVVTRLWPAAAQAIDHGQPAAAVTYLRRALAEPAPGDIRPDLLLDLARAEALIGDDAALDHFVEASSLHRDRDRRAEALLAAGRFHTDRGRTEEAAAVIQRGLALHPRDPRIVQRLRAAHVAAAQLDLGLRRVSACAMTPREVPSCATPEDRALLAHATLERTLRGTDLDTARTWVEMLTARLEMGGASCEAEAVGATSGALLWLGLPARAEPILDACLRRSLDGDALATSATLSTRRAMVRAMRGDLRGAAADAQWALSVADSGWSRLRPAAHAVLASSQTAMGDFRGARATLALPAGVSEWASTPLGVLVLTAQADLELAEGQPERALEQYASAAELAQDAMLRNPLVVSIPSGRAIAHLHLGHHARAQELAEEALVSARELGVDLAEGRALHLAARVTDRGEAVELLEQAIVLFDAAGARLDLAGAHLDLGVALINKGTRRAGIAQLRTSLESGAACGAEPLVQRAQAALRRANARSTRPRSGIDALTPGEQRAAELARSGLTNREIAEQLFVSVKAVEWHLSNVYRKLGVRGRRELARLETFEPSSGATRR